VPLSGAEEEKKRAAEEAAKLVEDGMAVGLGTGSTVACLLPALAARGLDIRCVATSVRTEVDGRALGLHVEPFDRLDRLDMAIDGADQVTPDHWLVKGAGGAHTREKIVAAAAERFVVIVDRSKLVERIATPVPLELHAFGLASTLRRLGPVAVRPDTPPSPDAGVIADWMGPVDDPQVLAAHLSGAAGVVDHGLFPPSMVTDVVVGQPNSVLFL
jgi:ribose 5-phosphate isomerase A